MFRSLFAFLSLMSLPVFGADPSPEVLIEAGHWKHARSVLEARIGPNGPTDALSTYLLSRVKLAFGDLDAALKLAEQAVALGGANANYHFQLGVVCGEMADKASLFAKAGWARRFKEEAEKAAALDANHLDSRFALLEYYLQAPRLMGGNKDKARAMANEIARIDPARGALAEARIAQLEKDLPKEEAAYQKALALAPREYEVLESLANFYWNTQKKPELAEGYSRQAISIDATRAGAYAVLASVLASGGRGKDLDKLLQDAEKNVPDNLNPYYQAGLALFVEGKDLPHSEKYFRKYLTTEPEAEAPALAHAHWRLGLVLEKEGRKPEAILEIETALQLKPDLREAKKDLARLK